MAKPRQTTFTEEFEPIIVGAWDVNQDALNGTLLDRTRQAISEIRRIYRFKDAPYPSLLDYGLSKYRAGYLAAFGQRHAYLAYHQLKRIEVNHPDAIPQPDSNGELTVTVLGAGAALETYGICLYYNESKHTLKRLNLNLIEKVSEWKPCRQIVIGRLLKDKFPKVKVLANDIDADICETECIYKFAARHDDLISTKILLIYNVMNEIETRFAKSVWRNLKSIVRQSDYDLLVLVAEPTAPKAWPRINWLRRRLSECSHVLMNDADTEIRFDRSPISVELEGTGRGLNDRLFTALPNKSSPLLQDTLRRMLMACRIHPHSPVPPEVVNQQLENLSVKREHGRFVSRRRVGAVPFPGFFEALGFTAFCDREETQ